MNEWWDRKCRTDTVVGKKSLVCRGNAAQQALAPLCMKTSMMSLWRRPCSAQKTGRSATPLMMTPSRVPRSETFPLGFRKVSFFRKMCLSQCELKRSNAWSNTWVYIEKIVWACNALLLRCITIMGVHLWADNYHCDCCFALHASVTDAVTSIHWLPSVLATLSRMFQQYACWLLCC